MKDDGTRPKCPGQDMRFWKPGDIFTVKCRSCGNEIEFWKDEPFLYCRKCGRESKNPRMDFGCAKWCRHAEQCLGKDIAKESHANPVVEKLLDAISKHLGIDAGKTVKAEELCHKSDTFLSGFSSDPCLIKCSLIILTFFDGDAIDYLLVDGILSESGLEEDLRRAVIGMVKSFKEGGNYSSGDLCILGKIIAHR